ncbi:MAG: GNAT family N-acetyltransferase [Bacillota bacterium]|nr:GNAT family N-acetyltransferase [Bacillota bacterium]
MTAMRFFETGPEARVTPGIRQDLERLCSAVYSGLPWYERTAACPLLDQIDRGQKGGVAYVQQDGRIVASHGYQEMDTKIRLLSWGPACEPGHEGAVQPLIADLMERGRALGKERVVVVLTGEPGGQDTRWYVEEHCRAGIPVIMTRLDMEAPLDQVRLCHVPQPDGAVWQGIDTSKLDEFLPLYKKVFSTSESPLTRSWAKNIEERRWWFEQMAQGEDGELVPDGWATLAIGGERAGFVMLAMKSPTVAHISDLGLVTSARGKRLGWFLMARAVEVARRAGATTIELGVEIENRVAISLYETAGFRTVARTVVLLRYF